MELIDQIKIWRRHLHTIPEEGLQEYQTAEYIREELKKMGYSYDTFQTSTFVYINKNKEHTIAFRCDIDGLPILEKNEIDFKSQHEGFMHACGHDGHTTTMLAFASELRNMEYDYNVVLIFQMAEESPGGAKIILDHGVLDQYHIDAIFGLHLMPDIEEGKIACKAGPLMAQCGELNLTVHGKSAHAGLYFKGVDAIYIANQLYQAYKGIFLINTSPFQPCLLNIGKFEGGTVRNIVANQCSFYGTMRCYDSQLFLKITDQMRKMNASYEEIYDCKIDFECEPMYPPVLNDEYLYHQFSQYIDHIELKEPLMLAEDFAYYQTKLPGVFFYVGTMTKEYHSGLHTETFNFNEEVLLKGVETYKKLLTNIKL